ncbi:MAG: serine hydrolase [Candidatus Saccharimonas sp.]
METGRERGRFAERYHAVKGRARHHYHRVMPDRKRHRVMIWAGVLAYCAVVVLQLLYPVDRSLPLAMIAGEYVGWRTHDELAAYTQEKFQATTARLQTGKSSSTFVLATAGADIDTEGIVAQTQDYPLLWRYIPLSLLWQPVQVHDYGLSYSHEILGDFGDKQATMLAVKPVNARLEIQKGKLVAVDDTSGVTVKADDIRERLRTLVPHYGRENIINLDTKVIPPERPASDFADVRERAEAVLTHEVRVEVGGKTFTPSVDERASWLRIGSDEHDKPTLTLDEAAVAKYLDTIDASVGTPAGTTHVTITNGRETARTVGISGSAVTRPPFIATLQQWVSTGETPVRQVLALHDTSPVVIYNNKYTASQEGLQAYLDDTAKRMDVHIALRQLDGARWSASVRADDSIPSASTYKLYVAKWVFTQMEAGKIGWSDPILDTTVTTCFDRMTIASTNPCAQEWLRQYGRDNMNQFVYGLGFSAGTSFTNPVATHTTANDLLKFMVGLNDSSLVSGTYRDRLLHSLSVHPYRYGIPTGSKGRVEDKVGFLWDYVHDAAIVHHPKGTYAMVIMTKGQSYARIAELTREIERILYP